MRATRPSLLLLVGLLAGAGSTAGVPPAPAPAQTSAPQAGSERDAADDGAPVRLMLVATPGVTSIAPDRGSHDFGPVRLLDRTRITHRFVWRNEAAGPIRIERIQGSCACTTARVEKAGKGEMTSPGRPPITLHAGDELSVRALLDLVPLPPGPVRESVSVYVQGQRAPAAVAEVRGTLLSSVKFTPARADFGRLRYGEEKALILTATFDPRLIAAGPPPPLVSSNPSITVEPLSAEKRPGGRVHASGMRPDAPSRSYRLRLRRNAPLGPIEGEISFSLPDVPSVAARSSDGVAAALRSARLVAVGQVVGDLSAEPSLVFFGVVPKGEGASRRIVLEGRNPAALLTLKIASASTWLSSHLIAAPAVPAARSAEDAAQRTRMLEVRLAAGAPPGVFQSQLDISLRNGQRLVLPVAAYIKP